MCSKQQQQSFHFYDDQPIRKTRITVSQRVELEKEFHLNPFLSTRQKRGMAKLLNLTESQVARWFKHRRSLFKKQMKSKGVFMQQTEKDLCRPGGNMTGSFPLIGSLNSSSIESSCNRALSGSQSTVTDSSSVLSSISYDNQPIRKTRITLAQRVELEKEFHLNPFITGCRRKKLANRINLTERQVARWFKHRRSILKKQMETKGVFMQRAEKDLSRPGGKMTGSSPLIGSPNSSSIASSCNRTLSGSQSTATDNSSVLSSISYGRQTSCNNICSDLSSYTIRGHPDSLLSSPNKLSTSNPSSFPCSNENKLFSSYEGGNIQLPNTYDDSNMLSHDHNLPFAQNETEKKIILSSPSSYSTSSQHVLTPPSSVSYGRQTYSNNIFSDFSFYTTRTHSDPHLSSPNTLSTSSPSSFPCSKGNKLFSSNEVRSSQFPNTFADSNMLSHCHDLLFAGNEIEKIILSSPSGSSTHSQHVSTPTSPVAYARQTSSNTIFSDSSSYTIRKHCDPLLNSPNKMLSSSPSSFPCSNANKLFSLNEGGNLQFHSIYTDSKILSHGHYLPFSQNEAGKRRILSSSSSSSNPFQCVSTSPLEVSNVRQNSFNNICSDLSSSTIRTHSDPFLSLPNKLLTSSPSSLPRSNGNKLFSSNEGENIQFPNTYADSNMLSHGHDFPLAQNEAEKKRILSSPSSSSTPQCVSSQPSPVSYGIRTSSSNICSDLS